MTSIGTSTITHNHVGSSSKELGVGVNKKSVEIESSDSIQQAPSLRLFGAFREIERSNYSVPRYAHIRVTSIELVDSSVNNEVVQISVSMNRCKGTLHTNAMEIYPEARILDFYFACRYQHSVRKSDDDILIIKLHKSEKKRLGRSKKRGHYSTLSSCSINMDDIIQCPLDADILLKTTSKDKDIKISGTPFAKMHVCIMSYPEEVESPEDALEWEDILFDLQCSDDDDDDLSELSELDNAQLLQINKKNDQESLASRLKGLYPQYDFDRQYKKGKRGRLHQLKKILSSQKQQSSTDEEDNRDVHSPPLNNLVDLNCPLDKDLLLPSSSSSESLDESPVHSPPIEISLSSFRKRSTSLTLQLGTSPTPTGYLQKNENSPYSKASTVETVVSPFSLEFQPSDILLVDGMSSRGRKLVEIADRLEGPISNRFCVACSKGYEELSTILSAVFSKNHARSDESMKVIIAGNDSFVSDVLHQYVEFQSNKPRNWESVRFFLIPLGKNNNDIAQNIASQDNEYSSLFFSDEWHRIFERNYIPSADECAEVEQRIVQYTEDAHTTCNLPIGEALLTHPEVASRAVPFIKSLQIGIKEESEKTSCTSDLGLQLDYWPAAMKKNDKKKNGGRQSIKTSLQFVLVTRLRRITRKLRISDPTLETLSMFVQRRDKKQSKNVLMRLKGGKVTKKEKEIEKSERRKDDKIDKRDVQEVQKKEEKEKIDSLSESVNRLVCSSVIDNKSFKVTIDGREWDDIKFVSVSPQWGTHVKTFPIQVMSLSPSE